MDTASTSLATGLFSGVFLIGAALAYVVPVSIIGLMLYYFTGDKKHGSGIIANMMNVFMRLYTNVWMFVAAIIGLIGSSSALNYILQKIFGVESRFSEDTSEPFLRGLIYVILALVIFGVHFVINNFVLNPLQKRGTLLSKLFLGFGFLVFSVISFSAVMTVIDSLIVEIYDTYDASDTLIKGFALLVPSVTLWVVYLYRGWVVVKKEN